LALAHRRTQPKDRASGSATEPWCPAKSNAPSDVRADVIAQFHERAGGGGMTEVLIDLESDEMLPSGQQRAPALA
jgi:hypothetical protein